MAKRTRTTKQPDMFAQNQFLAGLQAGRGAPGDEGWRPVLRRDDFTLLRDFCDHLTARQIAWTTIQSYANDLAALARFLQVRHQGFTLLTCTAKHVESWLAQCVSQNLADSTLRRRFMAVRVLDNWLRDTGEIQAPRTSRHAPRVALKPIHVIPIADIETVAAMLQRKIAAATKRRRAGRATADEVDAKRDLAIILVALGCGMRVDELARLGLDDIERGTNTITIRNPKGGESKARQVAIPADLRKISPRLPSPLEALNAYKRVRGDRRQAIDTDALWIGDKGPWTTNGIRLMLRRACQQAGVAPFTPHRFRHTWAHWAKVLGMQHGDLKVVGGWSSDAMVDRYGRSEAQARALDVHRQVFSGD